MSNTIRSTEIARGEDCAKAIEAGPACFHCGELCRDGVHRSHDKNFCCGGCQTVFELLTENGLDQFYSFEAAAGVKVRASGERRAFDYLDDPALQRRLVDFSNDCVTRATFRVPAMHCIACVWLLENLFRLNPGIGYSRANFPRKEVFVSFDNAKTKLSQVVALLASLGYPPEFNFSDTDQQPRPSTSRRLWLQMGVAGFAFGNIMLMSIASYLGLDAFAGPALKKMFGWTSLILAAPALVYSGADYWRAAMLAWRRKIFTIEVPIAAGLVALAGWSASEVFTGRGPGYFDSLSGLLFFLLCGRMFQQKTFDLLAFDRDYKSFFPLSILRVNGGREDWISLSHLKVGDQLLIRNGELIPADAKLISGAGMIDYSFVTGEAVPVEKHGGDHIYAGGRQMGGTITIETAKDVSQSYLTSLWNQDALGKEKKTSLDTLTNRYSQRFTKIVLAVAIGAGLFWWWSDSSKALGAFVSVLIVACPCALALAAPFALGTAQRVLGRRNVYLKNSSVIETLAKVETVVFDKTGTLTAQGAGAVAFWGDPLRAAERAWIHAVARHSTHPHAVSVTAFTATNYVVDEARSFAETAGCGMEGIVAGREIWIGSATWLKSRKVEFRMPPKGGGAVVVAIDGIYRGCFTLASAIRADVAEAIRQLDPDHELALLSGDNEREREQFAEIFDRASEMRFNQSPLDKLEFVRRQKKMGRNVMMVGDGLNDAGALKQSDVGIAVVENMGAFSPASDIIMSARMVPRLHEILRFAKSSVRIVQISLLISTLYNVVGLAIAARGMLSPVICAILMPVSSVTVVAFACGMTARLGKRIGNAANEMQANEEEAAA